jgi:hypothetical protein
MYVHVGHLSNNEASIYSYKQLIFYMDRNIDAQYNLFSPE